MSGQRHESFSMTTLCLWIEDLQLLGDPQCCDYFISTTTIQANTVQLILPNKFTHKTQLHALLDHKLQSVFVI